MSEIRPIEQQGEMLLIVCRQSFIPSRSIEYNSKLFRDRLSKELAFPIGGYEPPSEGQMYPTLNELKPFILKACKRVNWYSKHFITAIENFCKIGERIDIGEKVEQDYLFLKNNNFKVYDKIQNISYTPYLCYVSRGCM